MRSFLAILASGLASFYAQASVNSCSLSLQLSAYQPQSCYSKFLEDQCVDSCNTADPEFDKQCFTKMEVPCHIKQELLDISPTAQTRGVFDWIHISDLLSYPGLTEDIHIIQSQLFIDLYEQYVKPPPYQGMTGGTLALKKQNFRLNMLDAVAKISAPLSESGAYRRLEYGRSVENQLEEIFLSLFIQTNNNPYFTKQEKDTLINELNTLWNQKTRLWSLIKNFDINSVGLSRVSYLNGKLRNFVSDLNNLPEYKREEITTKVILLNRYSPGLIIQCGDNFDLFCVEELIFDEEFYPEKDIQLTFLESNLNLLENEVEALSFTYDENLIPTIPTSDSLPDFSGFLDREFQTFSSEPSEDALLRLESAISIAFLQQGKTGEETFQELSENSIQIQENAFLGRFESKPILLCQEYLQLDENLDSIKLQVFEKSNEARDVMAAMYEEGRTLDLMNRLQQLLAEITQLTFDSQAITRIDRFNHDRQLNVKWLLNKSNGYSIDSETYRISIEYIAFNGMFWIPSMSMQLSQILPEVHNIFTVAGSLLPNGIGTTTGLNELGVTLKASPYTACAASNSRLNLIVSLEDDEGNSERYSLVANMDQL